jgi:hypothetical protein
MLALKNRDQVVHASIPGLAKVAGITIDECEVALRAMMLPDPYSRTPDQEGRRIQKVDGGWFIINGEKYRDYMSYDERREYKRKKQQEYRKRDDEASA